MRHLNLNIPTSFDELTQRQLFYYLHLVAAECYDADTIKSMCLLRFAEVEVEDDGQNFLLVVDKRKYNIHPRQIAEVLPMMDWIMQLPELPTNIKVIQFNKAKYDPSLNGLPFEKYIVLENLYQGYLHTKQTELVEEMAAILYGKMMKLTKTETYAVVFWWTTLKNYLAHYFPNYFVSSPVSEMQDVNAVGEQLRKQVDTQIRALTKGDITKEKEVLAMDMWRALTELDAQAYEYEQMKKQLQK